LAEVLRVPLASDMAIGLPAEHGLRSCYISMHLADEIELSPRERSIVLRQPGEGRRLHL
jgi:hypothetical protein